MAAFGEKLLAIGQPALSPLLRVRAKNPRLFDVVAAAGAAVLLVGALIAAFSSTDSVILASNLPPADQMALEMRLRRQGISFHNDQGAIEIPENRAREAREMLRSQPDFAGGGEGFSLFDHLGLGETAFAEQVTYQRALQGELERTIMNIKGIENARVMLALGRPSPFALGARQSSHASVVLTAAPGAVIDELTARAIAHVVAASAAGLEPDNVVVTQNDGTALYPPPHASLGQAGDALEVRRKIERELTEKADQLLKGITGDGLYRVEVSVGLDSERRQETVFDYDGKNEARLSEERTVGPASPGERGIPGLTANLPKPQALPSPSAAKPVAKPKAAATPAAQSQTAYLKPVMQKEIINYEPSTHKVERTSEPLTIERISLAAVVDGTYKDGTFQPLSPARLKEIQRLLAAAVGAVPERGDLVEVSSAALTHPYIPPAPAFADRVKTLLNNPKTILSGAGTALLMLILALWFITRRIRRASAARQLKREMQKAEPKRMAEPAQDRTAMAASAEGDLRTRASILSERNPDSAAAVLRRWIKEGVVVSGSGGVER
ncbi:MAG: flagellar basal-body MS-ring/collar protein FliF [Candidatus Binataceae bacterium]